MALIRSSFIPRSILSESKAIESKVEESGQFEAIWIFELVGRNFELYKNPLEHGVLETNKCFYIIFYRNQKLAIYLWMGAGQSLLNIRDAAQFMMDTTFSWVKN